MRPLLPRQPSAPATAVPHRGVVTVPERAAGEERPAVSRRRTVILVVAAVVVVLLVLLLIPLMRSNDDAKPRGAGGPSGGAKATSQSAAPAQSSTGAPTPSATGGTAGPGATGGTTAPPQVPAGWRTYKGPGGFVVRIPFDYTFRRDGTMVYFDEKNGPRLLGIDQTDTPKEDPVKDWREQAAARSADGDWDDYHQIKIVKVTYFKAAADWEWTYNNGGTRTHVVNRGFVTGPKQAHAIYWSTPQSQWDKNYPIFQLIAQTFRPNPA